MGFLFLCLLRFISQSTHYSWELHMSHGRSSGSHVDQIEDLSSCVRVAWHHGKRKRSGCKQSKGHHHKIMNRIDIMRTARPLKDKKGRRPPWKECSHHPLRPSETSLGHVIEGCRFARIYYYYHRCPFHIINWIVPIHYGLFVRPSCRALSSPQLLRIEWKRTMAERTGLEWTTLMKSDWTGWWIGGELHSSCLGIIW